MFFLLGKVESSKAFDTHGNFRADEDMLNYVKGLPNGYAPNLLQFTLFYLRNMMKLLYTFRLIITYLKT